MAASARDPSFRTDDRQKVGAGPGAAPQARSLTLARNLGKGSPAGRMPCRGRALRCGNLKERPGKRDGKAALTGNAPARTVAMTDRQPDFVIVGATKSATTWLQRNLQQHAAVFMPGTETHYFSWYFERGPAWYGAFFAPAAAHQIVGEKSTSYLDHPEAAQRLREALPEVRLILQLRNPIERVWAHYRMDSGAAKSAPTSTAPARRPRRGRAAARGRPVLPPRLQVLRAVPARAAVRDAVRRSRPRAGERAEPGPRAYRPRERRRCRRSSRSRNAGEPRGSRRRPDQAVGRWCPAPPDRHRARPIRRATPS